MGSFRTRYLLAAMGLLASAGTHACEILDIRVNCATDRVFGVGLVVGDSITGGPVRAEAIRVEARDGRYVEEIVVRPDRVQPTVIGIVEDRPGTYRITVTASGYAPWVRADVRVRPGAACHVRSTSLHVRLQRLGGVSQHLLVDVAPAPVLARLQRAHDRMAGGVVVLRRVPVRR